ncbi:kinase-like domain-containing protein [Phaeosphaeriaceae sp. PMI808]|nr:kinase-like domain-containing protein [Phaeosphaeriaceae sp. PMI808]
MAPQGYEEELLQRWFPRPSHGTEHSPFTEKDIREISNILEHIEGGAWSRIPRVYVVLRIIDRLDFISSLIQQEISDAWFPFTQHSLPEGLRSHSKLFLQTQTLVCNKNALNLERKDSSHGHFRDPSEIPLKKIGELGKGSSGYVDLVISTVTYKQYALKLIKRGKTFKKDKKILRDFEKELFNLKKLSKGHRHIIDLVGSYTEPKYVGILFPVADCDLAAVMGRPDLSERRWSLRTYFGCLTSALSFLHAENIRHKDIKPQNILIKDNEPYFTDFGLALDWTGVGHSMTYGPTAMTPRYGAPEVAAFEPRNSSSDIWSLGCVFLEIWTVLRGASLKDLAVFTTSEGRILPYHSKDTQISAMISHIEELPGTVSDSLPSTWIKHMLQRDRHSRWSALEILECIQEHATDLETQYLYIGRCCLEDEDAAESVHSWISEDVDEGLAETDRQGEAAIIETAGNEVGETLSKLSLRNGTNEILSIRNDGVISPTMCANITPGESIEPSSVKDSDKTNFAPRTRVRWRDLGTKELPDDRSSSQTPGTRPQPEIQSPSAESRSQAAERPEKSYPMLGPTEYFENFGVNWRTQGWSMEQAQHQNLENQTFPFPPAVHPADANQEGRRESGGILRMPTKNFPEQPNIQHKPVARGKYATKDGSVPPRATWTKINRRLVDLEALDDAGERYVVHTDCVVVLRILTWEEIEGLAGRKFPHFLLSNVVETWDRNSRSNDYNIAIHPSTSVWNEVSYIESKHRIRDLV